MNSKTLTLAGAVILAIGLFLPIFTVMGMVSINFIAPGGSVSLDGIIVAVCAALAVGLALVNQTKWAVIPALGAVGVLIYDYMNIQNQLGGASASLSAEQAEMASAMLQVNFLGWAVMGVGALLILVGGIMGWKKTA
jgi:hypothetical protein